MDFCECNRVQRGGKYRPGEEIPVEPLVQYLNDTFQNKGTWPEGGGNLPLQD